MTPPEVRANRNYNDRVNTSNKSPHVLAKLIQVRDWQGVSRRARSHPHDVLIQDCNGLNPLHIALQSFYPTPATTALPLDTGVVRTRQDLTSQSDRPTSVCPIYPPTSTTIPLSALTNLLASPFSSQGLICQPPPLINTTMNPSTTSDSNSLSEARATPLHLACRNTCTPDSIIVSISRANPLALDLQDDDGDTPLHLALRYGVNNDVLQTLIELSYQQTLFHSYYDTDDEEEGVAFAKSDYEDGDLPLHVAISHAASIDTIQLLVDAYPQGMFGINHASQTPLMVACMCGRYDVVEEVILKSDVVMGCVRDLLEMGGDELGIGEGQPVYCLWENFVAAKNESSDIGGDVEALELISKLLTAATSSATSACQNVGRETIVDIHDKPVNYHKTTTETTFLKYSFDQSYQLLLAAINLGEGIVPPEYVSFLIDIHPDIIQRIHPSSGCTPLHIAVMQPYHQKLFLLGDCAVNLSRSTCSMQSVGINKNNDDSIPPIPDFKDVKITSSISPNGDGSSPKQSNTILKVILESYPMAAYQRDHFGYLPFHLAIKAGMAWEDGLKDVFMVAPEALRAREPNTGLYPFMLAASVNSATTIDVIDDDSSIEEEMEKQEINDSLDGVFSLLRCAPDLIAISCGEGNYSYKKSRGLNSETRNTSIAGQTLTNLRTSVAADFLRPSKRHKP